MTLPAQSGFLDIDIYEIGTYYVRMTVTPEDETATYCLRIAKASEYDSYSSEEEIIEADSAFFVSQSEEIGITLEEYLEERLHKGMRYISISAIMQATPYVVYGYALDVKGNAGSGISMARFVTAKEEEKAYKIEIDEVTSSTASIIVTSSEPNVSFLCGMLEWDEYNKYSDDELIEMIIAADPSAVPETSVPALKTFEGLKEHTIYLAYAFGFADGKVTTNLTRKGVETTYDN